MNNLGAIEVWQDGRHWLVQGITYDYLACGETVEEAFSQFGAGLEMTRQIRETRGLPPLPRRSFLGGYLQNRWHDTALFWWCHEYILCPLAARRRVK